MKVLAAVACLAAVAAAAVGIGLVERDATVSYNGMTCGAVPCESIPLGMESTVVSFRGNRDYRRILLGFDVPRDPPASCSLMIPRPVEGADYKLAVVETDSNWDEATVSGATKSIDGTRIATVSAPDASVDITDACRRAAGKRLSLFVNTEAQGVTFNSRQSGKDDVFAIQYAYPPPVHD
ncbi:hypothetical protein H4R18_004177 [Coemansia javaensis]|uniref:DUF4360 domain-containing protein n=1 Tax=Coemansia javaensis TaxID=2761396 RepID=A0A9W8H6W4_9FUNG|nr:hypothetical protein H4R18_004177 [Coemansia javaensis]